MNQQDRNFAACAFVAVVVLHIATLAYLANVAARVDAAGDEADASRRAGNLAAQAAREARDAADRCQ